jgi:hypothetical protein
MNFRRRRPVLNILIDTGLDLLTSLRDRVPDVRDTYDTASDRVSRAAGALRGEAESHILGTVTTLAVGVGIGVGIGLLIAPTTGEQTRADLAEIASNVGDKFREATQRKSVKSEGANETTPRSNDQEVG